MSRRYISRVLIPSELSTKTTRAGAAFVRVTDTSLLGMPPKCCLGGHWVRLRHSHRPPDDIRAQSLTAPLIKTVMLPL